MPDIEKIKSMPYQSGKITWTIPNMGVLIESMKAVAEKLPKDQDEEVIELSPKFEIGNVTLFILINFPVDSDQCNINVKIEQEKIMSLEMKMFKSGEILFKGSTTCLMNPTKMVGFDFKKSESIEEMSNWKSVSIECDIELFENPEAILKSMNDLAIRKIEARQNLYSDMEKAFRNKDGKDFIIKCEDQEFPCHRLLLTLRSPVFKAMLEHETKETKSGLLIISDSKSKSVKALLE